jgi:recombination protein RecT
MSTQIQTQEQSKALTPAQLFEKQTKSYENVVMKLLADKGISADKFLVTAINAVKKTPKLLDVDRKSLFGAILTAAELGLEPNTPMGHCYLIPYGNQCQFQVGYQGLVELAYRNPRVMRISSEIVYEKDLFEYELGLTPKLKHVPSSETNRGVLAYVYAVVQLKDAEPLFVVLSKADIDNAKKLSKASLAWGSAMDFMNWMPKKTAIKQVLKLVPKGAVPQLAKAIHVDSVIDGGGKLSATEDGEVEVMDSKIAATDGMRSNAELLSNESEQVEDKQAVEVVSETATETIEPTKDLFANSEKTKKK